MYSWCIVGARRCMVCFEFTLHVYRSTKESNSPKTSPSSLLSLKVDQSCSILPRIRVERGLHPWPFTSLLERNLATSPQNSPLGWQDLISCQLLKSRSWSKWNRRLEGRGRGPLWCYYWRPRDQLGRMYSVYRCTLPRGSLRFCFPEGVSQVDSLST